MTFDKAGNAWVDSKDGDQIAKFSAGELTSSGIKSADVLLSDDGGCTNLCSPGEIAFDQRGNLWVPNEDANTVVEYTKDQLTSSGKPAPAVTLSSAIFDAPWGAVFDTSGNLVVMNYSDGEIAKFTSQTVEGERRTDSRGLSQGIEYLGLSDHLRSGFIAPWRSPSALSRDLARLLERLFHRGGFEREAARFGQEECDDDRVGYREQA